MSTTPPAAAVPALSMKLLIDRKEQRVLFAEASKDVVDLLFSLLALSIATAVKLVGKDAMVGCVGNLYGSVDKLDSTYLLNGTANKDALLCPTVLSPAASAANSSLLRLPEPPPSVQPKKLYRCDSNSNTNSFGSAPSFGFSGSIVRTLSCRDYVTDEHGKACPTCHCAMTTAARFLPSASPDDGEDGGGTGQAAEAAAGFVRGVVTYTVMDDLTVTPMSAISSIALLNAFAVRDIGDLHEKTVQLGYNEGLAILKASLQSKSVLSDVFLHASKNNAPAASGGRG